MKATVLTLPLAAALALPLAAQAQNELSNFSATGRGGVINTFATDYQTIGINPANLGRKATHKAALTIAEVGVGVASQSVNRTLFNKLIFSPDDTLSTAGRANLVNKLTGSNTVNANVDVTTIGFAIALPPGLGSIAVSNRVRSGVHVGLSRTSADIIVNGKNAEVYTSGRYQTLDVATALQGTNMQGAVTSEYNIAYGVQVMDLPGFKLSAGAGYRYIQGIGIVDVRVEGGTFFGYSALSPRFKLNYGDIANDPNFQAVTGGGLKSVGHGSGFDLGLAAEIAKGIRLGVSVTDMGSMTWNGNVLTAQNQQLHLTNSNGVDTYNVLEELKKQFSDDSRSLFTYEANKTHNGALPTKFRTGAGVRISELFEAGLDVTVPLNDVASNIPSAFVGVGVDYKPVRWVRLSSGFTSGAGYGKSLPLGVTFVTKAWEAGISTRDLVGLFAEDSPYTSVALGVLRFKIGGEE